MHPVCPDCGARWAPSPAEPACPGCNLSLDDLEAAAAFLDNLEVNRDRHPR